ncbi:MAG: ArsR/SmtB family transcription factor [Gaiellaceae bacterium]
MSLPEVLTIDRPDQLKALGHPLRLRALEMLGQDEGAALTNRELAQRLGVDPGHLHFHVKMLLKAGLIESAGSGKGREKPYRAIARTLRIAPDLMAQGGATGVQAAILDEVTRSHTIYGPEGRFRSAQLTLRLDLERALELLAEFVEKLREEEDADAETIVVTAFAHPPAVRED